jgi:photosystem II stability/assembly factor-like uncharacterized protein
MRGGSRRPNWLLSGGLVLSLVVAACVASPATRPANLVAKPGLPAVARIVRTADISLPPAPQAPSALPAANQRDVVFLDSQVGFLATGGRETGTGQGGTYNTMLGGIQRTSDGGKTWQTVWTAPGADVSTVTFLSRSTGVAAGKTFSTDSTTSDSGQPLWLRSTDGGTNWLAETPQIPTAAADTWSVLRFAAATSTVILGTPDPNQSGGFGSIMLRSADGGAHWSQVGPTGWTSTGGVAFATPSLAFATGYLTTLAPPAVSSKLWRSRDAGLTWSAVAGTQVPFGLNALDFLDSLHGFAAGGNLAKYEMRPSRGLLVTGDGGRSWSVRYQSPDSDISNPITRVHFYDPSHGWAAIGACSEGQNGPCGGSVMLTADGGRSWHTTDRQAVDLSPVGPGEAWVIDGFEEAFPWHTVDAGASWTPVVNAGLLGIDSLAGSGGWLVASTAAGIWQSHDNGASWMPLDQSMVGPGARPGTVQLLARPPALLVLQQDAGLRISHDAGLHAFDVTLPGWDPNAFSPITAAFADSTHGMAIIGAQNCVKPPGYTGSATGTPPAGVPQGIATVALTIDGGTSWTARGSLDIQAWGAAAASGFWAITGSTGCTAPPGQVVMISRDNGTHWATQRLPTACFAISVAAPNTIWLNCQDWLLVTRDGAMTWTKYRFAQGLPSVLATGRDEAWAYGPAGALWHTTDGGQSWTASAPSF